MDSKETLQLINAMRQQSASLLASAIVAARAKPVSINDVLEIQRDIFNALYPEPSHGYYQQWQKSAEQLLTKVHD